MRRLLFSILGLSCVSLALGCNCVHSHGVCDCEHEDPCANRAPWVNYAEYSHGPNGSSHLAPTGHVPQVREYVPAAPKKL